MSVAKLNRIGCMHGKFDDVIKPFKGTFLGNAFIKCDGVIRITLTSMIWFNISAWASHDAYSVSVATRNATSALSFAHSNDP